jgi:hypothetical protein
MAKQSASDKLKESIRLLEIKQAEEGKILKEQFKLTYESLKPANLIKSTLKELAGTSDLKNNLFEMVISVLTGYLSKTLFVRSKSNIFVKMLGILLQFGVTNVVANNADSIRIFITNLIGRFLKPSKEVPEAGL